METLISLIGIAWVVGFMYFSGDPGDLINRQPSSRRAILWLTIVFWPITITYLAIKHYVILRDL